MPEAAMAVAGYERVLSPATECAAAAALASALAAVLASGACTWAGEPGWGADPRRRVISRASLALAPVGQSICVYIGACGEEEGKSGHREHIYMGRISGRPAQVAGYGYIYTAAAKRDQHPMATLLGCRCYSPPA